MAIKVLCIAEVPPQSAGLEGVTVEVARTAPEGLACLQGSSWDVVLAWFPLAGWTPEEVLEEVQRIDPLMPVLILQPEGALAEAVRLTKLGAYDYFTAGPAPERLRAALESAADYHQDRRLAIQGEPGAEPWRRILVGESRAMQEVFQVVRLVGPRRCTVLISGETGTGKEIVARAIHMASPRARLPLVAVNCHALPENLLEAELFGHVKGAFTGAVNGRIGRFEQAHRGTIFLDEIGDMPLELQAKLLRVLQEREFQRLGSSETIKVDVRVVAATNVDLAERVRQGRFREDLYYRLNVVPLALPSLRQRVRDIPLLVHHFIDKICRQEDLPLRQVAPETLERLCRYDWPGNVRQLENAVEMAIALSGNRTVLYPGDFPLPSVAAARPVPVTQTPVINVPDEGLDYEEIVSRIERALLEQAMQKAGGNKKQAAELLRLKRTTFAAKLKSIGLAAPGSRAYAHACAAG